MTDTVRPGSKGLLRDINNSHVLQIIQSRAPISRAEIAKLAELPPPTVTSIVGDFMRAGLVRETNIVRSSDDGNSAIGRRPILLTLNDDSAFAVGAKLRRHQLTLAVANLGGSLIYLADHSLDDGSPETVFERIELEVAEAIRQSAIPRSKVLGLGIGMPGLIDHVRGICRYSSLLEWADVDVKRALERRLDIPVYVDNDVNMVTTAEIAYGAGREVQDFLTVTIGQGIGVGIVIRGEIYRGAAGGAGEFGHTKVGTDLVCECGQQGCLEAVASEPAICAQVARALGVDAIAIEEVVHRAHVGGEPVISTVRNAGKVLGTNIGNLLNLFNPERVIVTGEGTRLGTVFLDAMHQAAQEAAFSRMGQDAQIVVQEWGDEAWVQGAASIAVHEMLKPPIYQSTARSVLDRLLDRTK